MDDAARSLSPQSAGAAEEAPASGGAAEPSTQPPASVAPATPGLQAAREAFPLPVTEGGRYVVQGVYAKGGIGRILRAKDERLGREVALKELPVHGGTEERRFLAEAQVTARLQHPAIVPVYDAGRWEDGRPFYAMKLVSGRSLAERMAEAHTLEERLRLLPHVLDAAEAGQGLRCCVSASGCRG